LRRDRFNTAKTQAISALPAGRMEPKSYEGLALAKSPGNYPCVSMASEERGTTMTLRHISPRSVEWYDAIFRENDDSLSAHDALALRTMKALEEVEIRIALSRVARPQGPLAVRPPAPQPRHA
jgi:hypothetical protein